MQSKGERNNLIIQNMYLVKQIVYSYSQKTKIDVQELESYGYEGLIYAVDHYKLDDYTNFKHYASKCIQGYILNGVVQVQKYCPKRLYFTFLKIKNEFEVLTGTTLEENPNLIYSILTYMENEKILTKESRENFETRFFLETADSLTFHKNDLAISDDNMFFEVTERINHEEIYDVLDKLTDIEKYIVKERFGLDGDDFKSLKEVGEELGICYEGVRKNEAKALHKIRACYYRKLKYMLEIYEYKEDNSYQIKEKIRGRK